MAKFIGRRIITLNSPQAADLARVFLGQWASGGPRLGEGETGAGFFALGANGRPIWRDYFAGDEGQPGSVVPFHQMGEGQLPWSQDLNALVAEAIRRGGLTAGEFARALNAHQPLSRAVVEADGSISYDAYSFDDEFDDGLLAMAGVSLFFGGAIGAWAAGGGGSQAAGFGDVIEQVGNFTGGGGAELGAGGFGDVIEQAGNFTGGGSQAASGSGAGSALDVIEEVGNFTGGAGSAAGSGLPLPPSTLPPGAGSLGQQLINRGVNALQGLAAQLLGGGEPDPLTSPAPSSGGARWLLLAAGAGVLFIAAR